MPGQGGHFTLAYEARGDIYFTLAYEARGDIYFTLAYARPRLAYPRSTGILYKARGILYTSL